MKILLTIICLGLCLFFGCAKLKDNLPAKFLNIKTDKLIGTDEFAVFHVAVEAPGDRNVRVNAVGEVVFEDTFAARPDSNILHLELTLVSTLIKTSDSPNMIKWYIQVKSAGHRMGHREINETSVQTLSDALSLKRIEDPQSFGQDIVLGEFQKEPIIISVE